MEERRETKIAIAALLAGCMIIATILLVKCSSDDAPTLDDPFDYQSDER